ncbi:uncharacterized protein LOC128713142 [Anopheles marshallii]|uniref:uncharacterized protein LOC128713142 n=1 Tax=Anopheles marshallii TaxID=1521116 RepID=UPI00237BA229|nr:uncharacterized protein LOC128713142 [Anopheles marshallii]
MEKTQCESTFCEHYKPLLVEEIALVENPADLHNGKCSVIGTLACTDNRLVSLRVPDLPSEMQLPDGACSVELCFNIYCGITPRGKHVEVTGILKLRNTSTGVTTDSGNLRSTLLCTGEEEFKQQDAEVSSIYIPYIEVHHIRTIAHARELISCNLELRKLNLLNMIEH